MLQATVESPVPLADSAFERSPGYWATVGRRLAGQKLGVAALAVILLLFVLAAFAPWLVPMDPYASSMLDRLKPIGFAGHPLGTDELGRDMLSRLMLGARLSLFIGITPVLLAFCVNVQNEPVYIKRSRPFRYEVGIILPGQASDYILVEPEYRRQWMGLPLPFDGRAHRIRDSGFCAGDREDLLKTAKSIGIYSHGCRVLDEPKLTRGVPPDGKAQRLVFHGLQWPAVMRDQHALRPQQSTSLPHVADFTKQDGIWI